MTAHRQTIACAGMDRLDLDRRARPHGKGRETHKECENNGLFHAQSSPRNLPCQARDCSKEPDEA